MRIRTGFVATVVAVAAVAAGGPGAEAATYTYTGSEQTFAVPANVTGVNVLAVGARGASCCGATITEAGGDGAMLTGDVSLPAGTSTLYVEVGGNGMGGSGGWNGGGGGPLGGGGATDLRTVSCSTSCATGGSTASLNSRLAVAGGGGGASDDAVGGSSGNHGGGPLGCELCGSGANSSDAPGTAAPASTVTSYCHSQGDQNGEIGNDGDLGLGGAGADFLLMGTPESGGGGGGLYGGGGGGQCYGSGATATANAGAGGGGWSAAPSSHDYSVVFDDPTDAAEVIITAPVPTATTTPTVAGGRTIGDVLSDTHAQWSTSEPLTGYSDQWERCDAFGAGCAAINGATAQTYTLVSGDVGDTIRVQETAENFYGASSVASTSATTGVVGRPPLPVAPPGISGTPTDGRVLLEAHGAWTDGPTAYGYRWKRCSGGTCAAIIGAVNQSYTLTAADVGSTIEVQETAANTYGASAPATSAATSTVQPATRFVLVGSPTASATGVSLSVLCRAAVGTVCRGSAQLTTLERRLGGKIVALSASAERHRKRVLVGSKSFTLVAGAQNEISVPLNGLGRKLLARFRQIPATLTIALLNTTTPTEIAARTTIKPKDKKRKHHQ